MRIRTLRVYWDTAQDQLSLQSKDRSNAMKNKRETLSVTASVFDPLGVILLVTIRG